MKNNYKALILDLDGTTVPNSMNGMPSKRVRDAITRARKKIHVGIATGRSLHWADPVLQQLKLSGPIILFDGAQIIDAETLQILYEKPIVVSDMKRIIDLLKEKKVRFFIDERKESMEYKDGYIPQDPISLVALDLTESQAEDLQESIAHIPTIVSHKVTAWNPGTIGVSITHALATKQHAILEVAKLLSIQTHEIIGVGDGPNDFPLLMACGLKVAMGNAVPDLKAIADYVAPTVDEDGVADVIEKFIL